MYCNSEATYLATVPRVTNAGGGELVVQSVGTVHLQRDGEARGRDAHGHLVQVATLSAAANSPVASHRNRFPGRVQWCRVHWCRMHCCRMRCCCLCGICSSSALPALRAAFRDDLTASSAIWSGHRGSTARKGTLSFTPPPPSTPGVAHERVRDRAR